MVKKKNKDVYKYLHILALAAGGLGISGGDRIFIEFARRWSKEIPTLIYVSEEGRQMCRRQNLGPPVDFDVRPQEGYLARILEGIRLGLTLKPENAENLIVYSASEFWMDSLPAFLLKLRFPKITWAAAWYQTAPNPLKGFTEGTRDERHYLSAFLYWLVQFPIKPIIKRFANFVLVNNEEEKKEFPVLNRENRAIVVLGAVNLQEINEWKNRFKNLPKIYDGVFQGRFHPQKGVTELIDIWRIVVDKRPDAKLVMIGDGPLMTSVKGKVQSAKLENNVILKGYLFDGEEKYRIFAQSRVVVHPAFFDSGGMASAEAMAFGLPAVGFNLKSYKYYYPKGMEKVKEGDLEAFAAEVLNLLSDQKLHIKIAKEGMDMINKSWSWDKRASSILNLMVK